MSRTYTNSSVLSRVIFGIVVIILIALFVFRQGVGPSSQDLAALADARSAALLDVRDWMQDKDLDTVTLLSKYNRSEGTGVSLEFRRYGCWFDGPGPDVLLSVGGIADATDKALNLAADADEYGIYRYVRHAGYFEVLVSGDPYSRIPGSTGTPMYYGESLPGPNSLTDLGGGWFCGEAAAGLIIDTHSSWFYIALVLLAYLAGSVAVALCYKKHEGRATVAGRHSEDVRRLSRLARQFSGKPAGGWDGFAYQLIFETEDGERVAVYVPRSVYDNLHDGDAGRLVYKQLGKRQKFVSFTVEEDGEPSGDARI
jgi:hypothetical protein